MHEWSNFTFITIWDRLYYFPSFTDKEIEALQSHRGSCRAWIWLDATGLYACALAITAYWLLKYLVLAQCFESWKKQYLSPSFQRFLTTCLLNRYYLHFTSEIAEVQRPLGRPPFTQIINGRAETLTQSHSVVSLSHYTATLLRWQPGFQVPSSRP